jgi:hypothetical protein
VLTGLSNRTFRFVSPGDDVQKFKEFLANPILFRVTDLEYLGRLRCFGLPGCSGIADQDSPTNQRFQFLLLPVKRKFRATDFTISLGEITTKIVSELKRHKLPHRPHQSTNYSRRSASSPTQVSARIRNYSYTSISAQGHSRKSTLVKVARGMLQAAGNSNQ